MFTFYIPIYDYRYVFYSTNKRSHDNPPKIRKDLHRIIICMDN